MTFEGVSSVTDFSRVKLLVNELIGLEASEHIADLDKRIKESYPKVDFGFQVLLERIFLNHIGEYIEDLPIIILQEERKFLARNICSLIITYSLIEKKDLRLFKYAVPQYVNGIITLILSMRHSILNISSKEN